ncbi:PIG-L family deacetylase, partial [Phenylobacterium sp.]|uniref:PIG-L family deacetylase n=1 Tax=Phenylobacterium sp. TaxID=1871053 RepID=UPI00121D3791
MTVVYILAHFDDEYCGLPLVTAAVAAGEDQLFLYVADYRTPDLAQRRHAESQALLAHLGVDPAKVVHAGRGAGAVDGAVHRALPAAYAALGAALADVGPISRIVVTAWEGGHMDHDMCALMATDIAATHGNPPIETISLYNGPRLPSIFFHGGWPLPQNGPIRRVRVGPAAWLSWMAAVRFFPSQTKTWLGLWPAMFWSYAWRGFGVQTLDPARVRERPHPGALFYERMFK